MKKPHAGYVVILDDVVFASGTTLEAAISDLANWMGSDEDLARAEAQSHANNWLGSRGIRVHGEFSAGPASARLMAALRSLDCPLPVCVDWSLELGAWDLRGGYYLDFYGFFDRDGAETYDDGYRADDWVGSADWRYREFGTSADGYAWLAANHRGPDSDGVTAVFVVVRE